MARVSPATGAADAAREKAQRDWTRNPDGQGRWGGA
jgi:hypothetical protein